MKDALGVDGPAAGSGSLPAPWVWVPRLLLFWLCAVLAAAWCVGLSLLFG